jgi:amino acid adenylation domain-containing protein
MSDTPPSAKKDLRGKIESLSAAQRAQLLRRLNGKAGALSPPAIPRRPDPRRAPLSYTQELLWLVDRLLPNRTAYSVCRMLRMKGALQVAALQAALNAIIARHEILRTTFDVLDGEPVQLIRDHVAFELPIIDLRTTPQADRQAQLRQLVLKEFGVPLDLARDLLLRATLFHLGPEEYALTLVTHHIASDGASKMILYRELSDLYTAFAAGKPCLPPEAPLQYGDFAHWQRAYLGAGVLAKQLAYWKQRLAGAPAVLEVPADYPRPAVFSFHGRREVKEVPNSLAAGLKDLSRREGVTVFMTGLAAFAALLYRYTGMTDIVVGTPVSIRNRVELEGVMGFFVNTLVVRTDLSGDPTFRDLLCRVRKVVLEAFEHQEMPFEVLLRELHPDRDLSHTPLVQVMFSVGKHDPMLTPEFPGVTLTPERVDRGVTKFDLIVGLTDGPDWMISGAEYSTDLFESATVQRLLGHFQTLMAGVVANPNLRLSELPLLSEAERRHLLIECNSTQADYPHDACIHELFEAQAARTPQVVAALFQGQALTYGELNARANRLAHDLRRRGVGPDVAAGICLERSLDLPVAILGVLKAGGVYVPLDPVYPAARLAAMLEDSGARVLLTQQRLRGLLPGGKDVLCLDTDAAALAGQSDANPARRASPDNIAYVIYTSGSTGKPRGVLVPHRGVVNHSVASTRLYGLRSDDRVLQFSSISFDISVEEMFPAWTVGAAVVFRHEDMPLTGPSFLQWLDQQAITVLDLPTAFWHEWVRDGALAAGTWPRSLRAVIVGGEKATAAALAAWAKAGTTAIRWFNTYGPTETTVIATAFEPAADAGAWQEEKDIPIGRPIANTRVYVLDAHLQPVPAGVTGELYVGGVSLARGYRNLPRLTAEKFVPDPFGAPGGRLYRTGDLVRYLPDGNVAFVGRSDDQVKVRGFRVEPGEVEAAMREHPGVREAVVSVTDDGPAGRRLVAHVLPGTNPPTVAELRSYLQGKLPAYMVPAAFVLVDRIPLTPSGKIDRKALPPAGPDAVEAPAASQEPRTPFEQALADIWCEVLGVERVGVEDNFFDLGGHSLLATRLIGRVRETFGVELGLRHFFETPTVAGLALTIVQEVAGAELRPVDV